MGPLDRMHNFNPIYVKLTEMWVHKQRKNQLFYNIDVF